MNAFYFGESPKTLFGAYHAPNAARDRRSGVVLCYPLGQEYIRSHRSFRQLAVKLAASGFHVLRFDYYACGDSAGNCDEGDVQQWLDDIATAIAEVKDHGGIERLFLIGLRLGAALAALYGAQNRVVENLVLWDPVIDGEFYIQEISAMHEDWLGDLLPRPPANILQSGEREILGFPFPAKMRDSITAINLLHLEQKPARGALIIENERQAENERLKAHLETIGVCCSRETIPDSRVWRKGEALNSVLMPNQTLQAIIHWLEKL
jgi:pimeloyl-ACP methyl ester carboxylesterase